MRVPTVPLLRDLGSAAATSFLREVRTFLQGIAGQRIVWGEHLSVTFSAPATTTNLRHNLGRQPKGYVVEGLSVAMTVSDAGTPTDDTLPLTSTAAGTARLWVY